MHGQAILATHGTATCHALHATKLTCVSHKLATHVTLRGGSVPGNVAPTYRARLQGTYVYTLFPSVVLKGGTAALA